MFYANGYFYCCDLIKEGIFYEKYVGLHIELHYIVLG